LSDDADADRGLQLRASETNWSSNTLRDVLFITLMVAGNVGFTFLLSYRYSPENKGPILVGLMITAVIVDGAGLFLCILYGLPGSANFASWCHVISTRLAPPPPHHRLLAPPNHNHGLAAHYGATQ
jgi:hypothetical protein